MIKLGNAAEPIGCGCFVLACATAWAIVAIARWLVEHGDRILALAEAGGAP